MPSPYIFCTALLTCSVASVCIAQAPAPVNNPHAPTASTPALTNTANPDATPTVSPLAARYAGSYRRGSVDTVEQLVLLPDNTYCYAVMAGSLDLFSGGRWQTAGSDPTGSTGITLQEVKPAKPIFPALALTKPGQSGQVIFNFHGRSMAKANAPVFAVSSTAALPATVQRLFPEDHNGWASSYTLPPMLVATAQYFYIGHLQKDTKKSAARLQMTQYKLGDANSVQIGFDRIQAMPLMAFSAQLVKVENEDALQLDGRKFGHKRDLSPKLMQDAQANCIAPALQPETVPARPRSDGASVLMPVQDFYPNPDAVQTKPWFDMKNKDAG